MKIDGYTPLPESSLPNQQGPTDPSATANRTAGSASVQDETSLSVALDKNQLLASQTAQTQNLRQERVVSLRSAVQQGTYQVSDQQIAGSMLSELLN